MSENSVAGKISEIRERWAKATPGPWEAEGLGLHMDGTSDIYRIHGQGSRGIANVARGEPIERHANATAIAAAPTDIAYLLGRVEELERENKPICVRCGLTPDMRVTVTESGKNAWICIECVKVLVPDDYERVTGKPAAALPSGAVGEEHKP